MNAPAQLTGEPLQRTVLAVPGAHCASCMAKMERGLAEVPGVVAARLNLTSRQLSISHDASVDLPRLVAATEALGFAAQPVNDASVPVDHGTRELLRATGVAGFAAMNIMLLSVSVWSGADGITRDLFHLISAVIAIPAVAYAGRPFFRSAWSALRKHRTNMDVPISIGVLLVTSLSLFESLTGGAEAYFDGAVMLLFFLLVGRVLDSMMRDRARDGVAALLKQMPAGAMVLDDQGHSHWCPATDLTPGMRILVAAGERLAADGLVEHGSSSADLSLLTGEADPQPIAVGDHVHGGTLNLIGALTVRLTATGEGTSLAEISRLMSEAAQGRSRYVRIADRAARLYAPAVHTLAALAFIMWMLIGAGWHQALLTAAAVLIITCPCALGLAVPAAQIVAVGSLMRAGILVKDGSALERLSEVDCALFDKTGTLTLGRAELIDHAGITPEARSVLLALASRSRHPLAQAIQRSMQALNVAPADLQEIHELPGFGVSGSYAGRRVTLGRAAGANALSSTLSGLGEPITLSFKDHLRPDVAETLGTLRDLGIDCSVASGDNAASVAAATEDLGLAAQSGMHPSDKLALIGRLAAGGRKVLMVGDGLNDGPALAAGHVSCAPASASDVGQNAADVVVLGDSLLPVARAVTAARRTMRIVRQNFILAIGYNLIAVPLAFTGRVTPLVAAVAMSASSLLVVGNALRLRGAAR